MADKREKIDQWIGEYLEGAKSDFSPEDLIGYIKSLTASRKSPKAVSFEDVLACLKSDDRVFPNPDGTFKPRSLFFSDAEFVIFPTEEEVQNGFIIPGHRFVPFCPSGIMPWQCVLRDGNGKEVPKKIIQGEIEDLQVYYRLLGLEYMLQFLLEDQESNSKIMHQKNISGDISLSLTAFDFAALFKNWNFKSGDALRCRVLDWNKGSYTFEYLAEHPAEKAEKQNRQWIRNLEKGFQKVFDSFVLGPPVPEQIAFAYFFAGEKCLKNPPLALGHFFREAKGIFHVKFGMEYRLWKNQDVNDVFLADAKKDSTTEPSDSLNDILRYLGCLFTGSEIESFMRDELFSRRGSVSDNGYTAVLDRLFEDEPPFSSSDQKTKFIRHVKKTWKNVCKSYNYFSDQKTGSIRQELLGILDDYYSWFNNFSLQYEDLREDEIPMQDFLSLTQGINSLSGLVDELDGNGGVDAGDLDEIREMIPVISQQIKQLQEEMEAKADSLLSGRTSADMDGPGGPFGSAASREPGGPFGSGKKKKSGKDSKIIEFKKETGKKSKKSDEESLFVFRISLKNISPQIWRKVQVPGSFYLDDLHMLIQEVMGWGDAHMHVFKIAGQTYGPADADVFSDDMFDFNEVDYTLDDLALTEKQKFLYTYDFGDSWDHQILVSKIVPASLVKPADYRPLCLDGKRACPPEDCGGVFGYAELLSRLEDSSEDPDLEWLEDFDPEYFDTDETNEELHSRWKRGK